MGTATPPIAPIRTVEGIPNLQSCNIASRCQSCNRVLDLHGTCLLPVPDTESSAPIAQLVEHLICNQEVGSSSLSGGTNSMHAPDSSCPPIIPSWPCGTLSPMPCGRDLGHDLAVLPCHVFPYHRALESSRRHGPIDRVDAMPGSSQLADAVDRLSLLLAWHYGGIAMSMADWSGCPERNLCALVP